MCRIPWHRNTARALLDAHNNNNANEEITREKKVGGPGGGDTLWKPDHCVQSCHVLHYGHIFLLYPYISRKDIALVKLLSLQLSSLQLLLPLHFGATPNCAYCC